MDTHRTAQFIASLMLANCEAYLTGRRSRTTWDTEQVRLWLLAKDHGVQPDVLRRVCPEVK